MKASQHKTKLMADSRSKAHSLTVASGGLQSHAVRIPPHADLVPSLLESAKRAMSASNSQSAFMMTCVGSLSEVTLRMAAKDNDMQSSSKKAKRDTSLAEETSLGVKTFDEHFEIVSLIGTFSADGGKHLHISVSNADGDVVGGHLMSGVVFTTLELVLGTISGVAFTREQDYQTGYKELVVKPDPPPSS